MNKIACIAGVGTWLPNKIRTNNEWPVEFSSKKTAKEKIELLFRDVKLPSDKKTADIVEKYFEMEASDPFIGSIKRHIADESDTAAMASALAGLEAIKNAGLTPDDIDVILCHDVTPDRPANYNSAKTAELINLKNARAMSVDSACSSSISHLEIAKAYIESGLAKNVLVTESHLVNRSFPMMHPAAPGLGDGAAAMVVSKDRGRFKIKCVHQVTHPEFSQAVLYVRGPDMSSEEPWYKSGGDFRIGSHNYLQAKYLMQETVTFGAKTIEEGLAKTISTKNIETLISVQPRGWIPGCIAERLGLPRSIAHETFERLGHLGAAGVFFNFKSAMDNNLFVDNSLAVLYAQGAGFTRAAAIIEV